MKGRSDDRILLSAEGKRGLRLGRLFGRVARTATRMKAATVAEIADSRECRSEPDWPERAALVVRATWSEGERIHRLAQLGHEYAALVALPTGPDAVAKG